MPHTSHIIATSYLLLHTVIPANSSTASVEYFRTQFSTDALLIAYFKNYSDIFVLERKVTSCCLRL